MPKSIRLECSCKDQGWGNPKGKLYARCISGGAGKWIEISKVPHQWSNLNLELLMERLMDHEQTPLQVELGFIVGGGGGHELHVMDAKLVITAKPPPEGRQLTNSILADALASHKTAEEQQSTKVVDFTKEDLDSFGITDLSITDFIEAGSSYFKPIASTAEILANPRLADALMEKTEFTQQEWDAFGVHDLRMHHVVKSGDSYFQPQFVAVTSTRGCCKKGQTQPDLRVLRRMAYYGDFGDDGHLKDPRPSARDTPIQRRVKQARLRRCDVLALILYTGVCVYLCGCRAARAHAVRVPPHGTSACSPCPPP
jgi:hypothetical protein